MSNIIAFPSMVISPEQWVEKNPSVFFVSEERRRRFCSWCNKAIRPRELYYGMFEIRLKFNDHERLVDCRVTKRVAERLHPRCAKEMTRPSKAARRGGK